MDAVDNAQAYGWYVAPAYTFSQLPGSPQLSYRVASFSGGATRNFDSLFTGLSDWGYWFQGELLGEWVLSNSNLQSHMVRGPFHLENVPLVNYLAAPFYLFDAMDTVDKIHARTLLPLTRATIRIVDSTRGVSAAAMRKAAVSPR